MCVYNIQRDAIESFLQACEDFGLRKIDLFVTEDLHSAAHLNQVSVFVYTFVLDVK